MSWLALYLQNFIQYLLHTKSSIGFFEIIENIIFTKNSHIWIKCIINARILCKYNKIYKVKHAYFFLCNQKIVFRRMISSSLIYSKYSQVKTRRRGWRATCIVPCGTSWSTIVLWRTLTGSHCVMEKRTLNCWKTWGNRFTIG